MIHNRSTDQWIDRLSERKKNHFVLVFHCPLSPQLLALSLPHFPHNGWLTQHACVRIFLTQTLALKHRIHLEQIALQPPKKPTLCPVCVSVCAYLCVWSLSEEAEVKG